MERGKSERALHFRLQVPSLATARSMAKDEDYFDDLRQLSKQNWFVRAQFQVIEDNHDHDDDDDDACYKVQV